MSDRVVVAPWDPAWPARFEHERDRLLPLFEPGRVRIEHVGSTAVPGLAAKPIVDVLLGVPTLAEIEARIPALEALGWQYVPEHEEVFPDRRFLARPAARPRSHHLHAVEIGTAFFRDHLAFRDHLRAHPADAAAYAALKRRLAERFRDDRPGYTEAKTAFIEGVLARCR
ncbi:MAG: GrpB family protein [Myxococcales bacterium]|nr:GrpB family protein [Myxococcales bacterium]